MTTATRSDALVLFGASGDLAHKKIFPALYAMYRRGKLDVPIVGVAKSGWTLNDLREHARDAVRTAAHFDERVFARFASQMRYVDGDYRSPETFRELHGALAGGPSSRCIISPFRPACFPPLWRGWATPGPPTELASSSKSRLGVI
jgi:glucose-6-phosphate 1-dehydrogenase